MKVGTNHPLLERVLIKWGDLILMFWIRTCVMELVIWNCDLLKRVENVWDKPFLYLVNNPCKVKSLSMCCQLDQTYYPSFHLTPCFNLVHLITTAIRFNHPCLHDLKSFRLRFLSTQKPLQTSIFTHTSIAIYFNAYTPTSSIEDTIIVTPTYSTYPQSPPRTFTSTNQKSNYKS
jgi:hypothetical protein